MEITSNDLKVSLRTLTPEDADALVSTANDPDVAYNMVDTSRIPDPFTRRDAIIFIDMARNAQIENSALNFGIIDLHTSITHRRVSSITMRSSRHRLCIALVSFLFRMGP